MPFDTGEQHGGGGGGDGPHNEDGIHAVVKTLLETLDVSCALNELCPTCVGASLMMTMFVALLKEDPEAADYVLTELMDEQIRNELGLETDNGL